MAEGQTMNQPALSRDHSERMLQAFGAELISDPETNSVTVTGPAQLHGQMCPRRYQLSCILVSGWSDCTGF